MTFQLENVQTNEYPHFDTVWLPPGYAYGLKEFWKITYCHLELF